MRKKISDIKNQKGLEPLVCLTAYSYPMAQLLDEFCDILLVGDSVGMTIYGAKNTLSVSLETMVNHGRAVVKGSKQALIVVDMPFGSYENSKEQALENAMKILQETNCDAVKLETASNMADTVSFLVENNINVMGHVGLMPQHVNEYGGYKYQGRDEKSAEIILNDAIKIAEAGAFAIVIEGVTEKLASIISKKLSIPTIGIGASVDCDGQILVIDDLLGLNQDFKPKFVKQYINLAEQIKSSVKQYQGEVKTRKFPAKEHCL